MDRREASHTPVLVTEVLDGLRPAPGSVFVDATFGRGGHARALLARLGPGGRLVVLDRDPDAVARAHGLAAQDSRVAVEHASFGHLAYVADAHGVTGRVDGIVLDIGVSAPQLEDPSRGFSFREEGPLDMRMDTTRGATAARWLAGASAVEIEDVLRRFGEERHARRVARAIVDARRRAPIDTTRRLADVVARAVPGRTRGRERKHPATRTFQAFRIVVNSELDELAAALGQSLEVLAPGGRLAVISFHSLEDRIVKRFIRDRSRAGDRDAPARLARVAGPLRPSPEEVRANARSRSAVLRIAEKLA